MEHTSETQEKASATERHESGLTPGRLDVTRDLAGAMGNQAFGRMLGRSPSSSGDALHAAHPTLVAALGRAQDPRARAGGIAVQRQSTIDMPPETVEGRVKTLDPRALGDARGQIRTDMATIRDRMRSTQVALTGGIDMFLTDQVFAGATEAEADFDGTFLKFAGKKVLDTAVEKVGGQIPYFKPIWDFTFGLMEELEKEGERAAKAKGEVEVGEFANTYRAKVIDEFNARIEKAGPAESELIRQYEILAGESPSRGVPKLPADATAGSQPVVVGDAAEFLTKLSSVANGWRVPKAVDCLQVIVEEWIHASEGDLMSRGGGDVYSNGRLNLKAKLLRDGDKWSVIARPTTGELVTERADKVVKSLTRILKDGKTINDVNVEKWLTIEVEDEVAWGLNDYYYVHLRWRTLDDVTVESTVPSPVERETVDKAPAIGARAIKELDLNTIRVTGLRPGGGGRKV